MHETFSRDETMNVNKGVFEHQVIGIDLSPTQPIE